MKPVLVLAGLLTVFLTVGYLASARESPGRYRKHAKKSTIEAWESHFEKKRELVPELAPLPDAPPVGVDFSGDYRFGRYDYDLHIEQSGTRVAFRSGGVDSQDIGGAFDTHGEGYVHNGRIHARWWCFDLTRNYANTGGAEIWFSDAARNRIYVRYYHDADETIEEGYGARLGTARRETLHYRIRVKQPDRTYTGTGILIRGTVKGRDGEAIPDAVVMRRHMEATAVRTDDQGRWSMRVKKVPAVLMFSAAARGYINAVDAILFQEFRGIHFILDPVGTEDDRRYVFVNPTPDKPTRRKWTPREGRKGFDLWRCGNCHRNSYDEWKISRHALAAKNEVTRAVYERDFLPALAAGKAEGDPGLCAACHAPQAALDGRSTPLAEVRGVALHGNHCDLCHKIHHIDDLEAPGARGSFALRRPAPDRTSVPGAIKRIFGTLADVDYRLMGPSYLPFFGTSALCAGCHQYTTPSGIPARQTYSEWALWATRQAEHRSCQSCHMPAGESREGKRAANRICINALRRPPEQIHHHGFVGREKTYEAVEVNTVAQREGDTVIVTTKISTHDVGHRIPTGSAGKHLLVVIHAVGKKGVLYERTDGPQVPDHAGGDPDLTRLDAAALHKRLENGDYAGFAGRDFALVLADAEGNTHVPFWRAARVIENTRLEPDSEVEVRHVFRIPAGERAVIRAELYHRLRFKATDVAGDVKGTGARPLDLLVAASTVAVK